MLYDVHGCYLWVVELYIIICFILLTYFLVFLTMNTANNKLIKHF